MSTEHPGSWTDDVSGRERVRQVVELLDGPTTVQAIADRAEVSRTTADDELKRLESDDWVTETTVEGKKAYDLNPVRMLFDEITDLIADNSREELEEQLANLTAQRDELADEHGADTLSEFRQRLAHEDLTSEQIRERQSVIATWETLDAEYSLVQHALELYDDVTELAGTESEKSSRLQV